MYVTTQSQTKSSLEIVFFFDKVIALIKLYSRYVL